ncbi:hypothetical protein FLONG3_678 [Fusarium longipes]|uniref:Uncharacterized protein n=1 Tax=Fusarium longipes TaxID=694270 RepID=A0A395T903_9HYPO|nr:hypothetical protein FLONG3_678 [Fusarium longipes]
MQSNASVKLYDLNSILSLASNEVRGIYESFYKAFRRPMKEVGLTDIFMLITRDKAKAIGKEVALKLMSNENENGADFSFTIHETPSSSSQVFFQAKVAKRKGDNVFCDFLYESKKTNHGVTVLEYQNLLLAGYAKSKKADAYYIVYDYETVWWVNAFALAKWFDEGGFKDPSDDQICIEAFNNLARRSFFEAMQDSK